MQNKCVDKPFWYMTLDKDCEMGMDGLYHLTSVGCSCCAGFDTITPEEYIILLDNCIRELKNIKKCVKDAK